MVNAKQAGDVLWQHPLVKRGTPKPIMGETTPFVFKGRLYRLENWQKFMELPRATCGERYLEDVVRIWDVAADKLVSVVLVGHSFGMAFVWEDRVYVYAAAHPAGRPWRTVTEITLTTSDDLVHWSEPETVIRAEGEEHLFNVAVCRGKDRFVLLYETNDRRWPPFTFKYCESDDLRHWKLIPDAVYGREKYVGGPALYYEGSWYYTLYLQDLGGKWETRLTRSRDLVHWQDAPVDRPFLTFDENRLFQYWHEGVQRTVHEINASDAELCVWQGKTLVYFNGGDQQSSGDLQEAVFDGSPRELFEAFYAEPTSGLAKQSSCPISGSPGGSPSQETLAFPGHGRARAPANSVEPLLPSRGFQPAASVTPSAVQLAYQELQFGTFIHFAMATVATDEERKNWWGMLCTPPAARFNPAKLDADQWMEAAKAMGARHVVLTTKHHCGFCLWPTQTTDYGVKSSPWKAGKGDILREFVDAARRHGLTPGFYFSGGDMHEGCHSTPDPQGKRKLVGDIERYTRIAMAQLEEILTGYGPLCVLWMDGAFDPFGADVLGPDGRPLGSARADAIAALIRKHQPGAVIMGGSRPDVRWCGNEEGLAPYPVWNVVEPGQGPGYWLPPEAAGWHVPEADVFVRDSWFWYPGSDRTLRTVDSLVDVYERSIGHGANLLMNLTPDDRGLIPESEMTRLREFGAALRGRFPAPLAVTDSEGRWSEGTTLELTVPVGRAVSAVSMEEDLRFGQRVRRYQVEAWSDGKWAVVAKGESIGRQRVQRFPGVKTERLRLRVLETDPLPKIRSFACYSDDRQGDRL